MTSKVAAAMQLNAIREGLLTTDSEVDVHPVARGSTEMLSEALHDRYHCPEGFFDFALTGNLSADRSFFKFGSDTIYGRRCAGKTSDDPEVVYDALRDAAVDDGRVALGFDPSEAIDNLRLERYAQAGNAALRTELFRRLYYLLRPVTTQGIRKCVQRFHHRAWKDREFPRWPVDTTVEDISERLLLMALEAKGVDRVPFIWFWPDGASGCVTMTHDVETRMGRDHCAKLMDVDDAFGMKAAFGIVPEERYSIDTNLPDSIRHRGFEVMIQDLNHDGRLFDNREEFLRRAKLINHYAREFGATGFRAAVLYRKPEWFDAFEFSFDTSVPNVAHLDPQRGGCCTVMPYFIGDILELPVTTIQDYTLFHILNEPSIDLWKTQIDLVLKKNGVLSFIVHPDYVAEENALRIYEGLLGYLRELCCRMPIWCALPGEVDSWWRARNKMSVVKDGDSWRIEGDDTGRGVLAFATNVDGTLHYEVESPLGVSVTRTLHPDQF